MVAPLPGGTPEFSPRPRSKVAVQPRHDAVNVPPLAPVEEGFRNYRMALESCMATLLIDYHEVFVKTGQANTQDAALFRMEYNGVAIALRLLGGYNGVVFNYEWATSTDRPTVNWDALVEAGT